MNAMPRVIVNTRADVHRFDLDPTQVMDLTSVEEVNGEHALSVTTTQELDKTDRLLVRDGMGVWHEYVVLGIMAEHEDGGVVAHEYYCIWSIQYDLSATYINDQYGAGLVPFRKAVPVPPRTALECALSGTTRWAIGTVGVSTMSAGSFYRMSGWEGLQRVVERWGGEIGATITVGTAGVTGRAVDLLAHVGRTEATRRFDYGFDVTGIRRTVSDDVWPCRIVPLGKSSETDAGGYTRRPSIESANGGVPWVQDDDAALLTRIPDGNGGWEYPTIIVKNDSYEEPSDLLAWARQQVSEYCRPIVSYEAEVAQFVRAGMNAHGVALGDEVVVVDRTFGEGGLRLTARVVKVEQSLLDPARTKLTIGNASPTLAGQLNGISKSLEELVDQVAVTSTNQTTATYLDLLIGRLNDEINATGGYWYMVPGLGTRTYDREVSDPAVGTEATKVVEIRGGSIRIADSRTSSGDWDWKSVFTSGHIAAEMIVAAQLVSGFISGADGLCSWDLDGGVLQQKDANGTVLFRLDANGVYVNGQVRMARVISSALTYATEVGEFNDTFQTWYGTKSGTVYGLKVGSEHASPSSDNDVYVLPGNMTSNVMGAGIIASRSSLLVVGETANGQGAYLGLVRGSTRLSCGAGTGSPWSALTLSGKEFQFYSSNGSTGSIVMRMDTTDGVTIQDSLDVTGTKNRLVATEHYGQRRLSAYETPTPLFGDVGGGTVGEDGLCYVEVDDVLAEAARTDLGYHVLLQALGEGELWVAEKAPTHFVVRGTPGLGFDWELKARQRGFESLRLEDKGVLSANADDSGEYAGGIESAYEEDLRWADEVERAYAEDLAA